MARSRRPTDAGPEADNGVKNPDEHRLKTEIAVLISKLIGNKGLSQTEAGTKMDVPRSDVSNIVRGKLSGISLERLLKIVRKLGCDVEIRVKAPVRQRNGRLSLRVV